MCGRLKLDLPELKAIFAGVGDITHVEMPPGNSVIPMTDMTPKDLAQYRSVFYRDVKPGGQLLTVVDEGGNRILRPMRWGWGDPTHLLYNARFETASADRPNVWSDAWAHRRCVVPATMFFERWRRCVPADGELFYLGGLYNDERQVSIVTQPANDFVAVAHHRMPVVLNGPDARGWLNPENPDFARVINPDPALRAA